MFGIGDTFSRIFRSFSSHRTIKCLQSANHMRGRAPVQVAGNILKLLQIQNNILPPYQFRGNPSPMQK